MSNKLKERTDRRGLGWFTTLGMLVFLVSSPAWGLDLDQKISQQSADASQIATTLGHSGQHTFVAGESRRHKNNVRVVLIKAHKHKKRG